jgi:hypothetical protein
MAIDDNGNFFLKQINQDNIKLVYTDNRFRGYPIVSGMKFLLVAANMDGDIILFSPENLFEVHFF